MNGILRVLKFAIAVIQVILKFLNWWLWEIPLRFGVISIALYYYTCKLIFGTTEMYLIERMLNDNGYAVLFCWMIPFGFPMFLSFASMFAGSSDSKSTLDSVIQYRNSMMNVHSDAVASEIFNKSAHLDVMRANQSSSKAYGQASRGFDAKYGTHSPSYIYNDIMKNS